MTKKSYYKPTGKPRGRPPVNRELQRIVADVEPAYKEIFIDAGQGNITEGLRVCARLFREKQNLELAEGIEPSS